MILASSQTLSSDLIHTKAHYTVSLLVFNMRFYKANIHEKGKLRKKTIKIRAQINKI